MAPKVTIVMPVYKVEQYLPACIESVRAQTFTDWECILVDDGAPTAAAPSATRPPAGTSGSGWCTRRTVA